MIGSNVSITTTIDYDIPIQDMAPDSSMNLPICQQFLTDFEFYSPGYPQPYPNNTECVRVLKGIYEFKSF